MHRMSFYRHKKPSTSVASPFSHDANAILRVFAARLDLGTETACSLTYVALSHRPDRFEVSTAAPLHADALLSPAGLPDFLLPIEASDE